MLDDGNGSEGLGRRMPVQRAAEERAAIVAEGIVRGKFLILEMAWIHLIRSEKTAKYQWQRNADFVCGQVIN